MPPPDLESTLTHHALLVLWGQFAQQFGLIDALMAVPLHQKVVTHRPHTKVLEFLLAVLSGLPHLTDLSSAAHPLDQDQAVAQAWQQPAWADASGVSRTLQTLTQAEAQQIAQALAQCSQPILDREVVLALQTVGRLVYDGDLTGRPVSTTSTTYPGAAFGHMSDGLHLGYQAALVSMHSPTYGRMWLSVTPHPGNTLACSQAEALVRAAEATTGVRPYRRVALLRERLSALASERTMLEEQLARAQQRLDAAQARLETTLAQVCHWQAEVAHLTAIATRAPRPHSRLAHSQERLAVQQRRQLPRQRAVARTQTGCTRLSTLLDHLAATQSALTARLQQYEQDNAANAGPISAVFRLDAGFGTGENVALLIELGYEVYTKPYVHQVTERLRRQVGDTHPWQRVGANAEVATWAGEHIPSCPYPLDLALERFYTGATQRYSSLLHYGADAVVADAAGWFTTYNARQTIEAGIKEGKGVFQMHHLKVRSEAALWLQERLAAFAANFVRWAAHWLASDCPQTPTPVAARMDGGVKELVTVGAHTSAWVVWQPQGCLVTFTDQSVYAGHTVTSGTWAFQPPLPLFQSWHFSSG